MKNLILLTLFFLINKYAYAQYGEPIKIEYDLNNPSSVCSGDIDNDGDIDILATYLNSDRIGWFENSGNASNFSNMHLISSDEDGAISSALTDIDNDGDLDVICAAQESNRITAFKNINNSGVFEAGFFVSTTATSVDNLSVTDIDSDGDQDIVFLSYDNNRISWLANDGTGNFSNEHIITSLIFHPNNLSISDIDENNTPDIVFSSNSKLYYLSNIDGLASFSDTIFMFNASGIKEYTSFDMDNDGDLDFAVAKYEVYIHENAGGGNGYLPGVDITENFFGGFWDVASADFDGDGDLDLVCGSKTNHNIYWFENLDGQGTFDEGTLIELFGNQITIVQTLDMDNDTDLDVLAVHSSKNSISWYENLDNTDDFDSEKYISAGSNYLNTVNFEDMDGDGDEDILSSFNYGQSITWQENLGDNIHFGISHSLIDTDRGFLAFPLDIDHDGDEDVIANTRNEVGTYRLSSFENLDGLGNFGSEDLIEQNLGENIEIIAVDIDSDGDQDLLFHSSSAIYWFKQLPSNYYFGPIIIFTDVIAGTTADTSDIDGDGDIDIVASTGNSEIVWFENQDGLGDFSDKITIQSNSSIAVSIAASDADGDGDPDIIYSLTNGPSLAWIEHLDGSGTFSSPQLIPFNLSNINEIFAEDLDVDGDIDIAVASTFGVYFFANGGIGNFTNEGKILDLALTKAVLKDIDQDGDQDIISFYDYLNDLYITLNEVIDNNSTLKGTVFWDNNQNSQFDDGEIALHNQLVTIQPAAVNSWTTDDYTFKLNEGTYTVTCMPGSEWQLTTAATFLVTIPDSNMLLTQNFGVTAIPGIPPHGEISITSASTNCGFITPFWINYTNLSNTFVDGIISLELNGFSNILTTSPEPDSITSDHLFWFVDNLAPTVSDQIFLNIQIPGVDNIGEEIHYLAAFHILNENNVIVSTAQYNYSSVIQCGYDPNDKKVEPFYGENPNYTLFSDTLLYTVRFQNTGTDTAFNIQIKDKLNPYLDPSTMRVVAASHDYEVSFGNDDYLVFQFDNIFLPDSNVNEIASHGFIQFQILPVKPLPEFTLIENEAEIYFDFNPAIITNTVSSVLVTEFPVSFSAHPPDCFGENSGSLIVNSTNPLFLYHLDISPFTDTIEGLFAGEFNLTMTDLYGKILADTIINLMSPSELIALVNTTPDYDNTFIGTATAIITGGVEPYDFHWDILPDQNNDSIYGLQGGTYHLLIQDANNCIEEIEFTIDQVLNEEDITLSRFVQVYPNPTTNLTNIKLEIPTSSEEWSLNLYNAVGLSIMAFGQPGFQFMNNRLYTVALDPGVYNLILFYHNSYFCKKIIVIP